MECCNIEMSNFSYYEKDAVNRTPHFYCAKCGGHLFRGKVYTAEEWFFYINGVAYDKTTHILPYRHLLKKEK
jgi:hypothetical protein